MIDTKIFRPDLYDAMLLYKMDVMESETCNRVRFSLGDVRIEIDLDLGSVDVFDKTNRTCVQTFDNCIVATDVEEDID